MIQKRHHRFDDGFYPDAFVGVLRSANFY